MAPYAGNVAQGVFAFEQQEYVLPRNNGDHAAHGLVDDTAWKVLEHSATAVRLRTELPESWPFGGWVELRYQITDDSIQMALSCGNDARAMPVSLGFHPWFQRELEQQRAELAFQPEARFVSTIPGLFGELSANLGERPWDDPFLHHTSPVISWGSRELTLSSSESIWMVYEQQPEGFCVEPLTAAPDGLREDRARVSLPGAPVTLDFCMQWTVEGQRKPPLA